MKPAFNMIWFIKTLRTGLKEQLLISDTTINYTRNENVKDGNVDLPQLFKIS